MPTSPTTTVTRTTSVRRQLFEFYRPYLRLWLVPAFGYLLVAAVTGVIGVEIRRIVDHGMQIYTQYTASTRGGLGDVNLRLGIYVGLLALHAIGRLVGSFGVSWIDEHVCRDLRYALFETVTNRELEYLENERLSDIQSRLIVDLNKFQIKADVVFTVLLGNVPLALVGIGMMCALNWRWTLIAVVVETVIASCVLRGLGRIETAAVVVQSKLSRVSSDSLEVLRNIRLAKIDNHVYRHHSRFKGLLADHLQATIHLHRLRDTVTAISAFCGGAALVGLLWWGLADAARGLVTVGELVSFWFYAGAATSALLILTEVVTSGREAFGASRRALALLDRAPTAANKHALQNDRPLWGALAVRHISFTYATSPGKPALDDVCFELPPGGRIALVGRSGAGKSTLFDLIVRLRSPEKGEVFLDGVDTATFPIEQLRSNIALVPQDVVLFSWSVLDNIRYARPDASIAEVRAAAEAACANDFIERLPHGYDTTLGEMIRLSGGEKQRIAIARAFLKNPRILLLDEATGALDGETESQVRQALDTLMTGRTVLFATHRLANVVNMDRVLFLDHGRLVASGTHRALMANSQRYAELAQTQFFEAEVSTSVASSERSDCIL